MTGDPTGFLKFFNVAPLFDLFFTEYITFNTTLPRMYETNNSSIKCVLHNYFSTLQIIPPRINLINKIARL